MANAVRRYDNKEYKRTKKGNALDNIIEKFTDDAHKPARRKQKKSFIDKSVQNLAVDSIIEGYFPKENLIREMAIKRVNKTLCVSIGLLIAIAVISYYFVITCEMQLNDLSRQTVVLNNENEELQNKLDSLKSFSNVDATLQKNNIFQRSGKVIETPEVVAEPDEVMPEKDKKKRVFHYALGF